MRADFLTTMRKKMIPEEDVVGPTRPVLREVVRTGTGRAARLGDWATSRQNRDINR